MKSDTARSLRDEQRDVTRSRILTALAEVISRDGIAEFSVQEVADLAGVSHRTVYRHFPSRAELLEALSQFLDDEIRKRGAPGTPDSLEDLRWASRVVFSFLDEHPTLARALVILSQGGQLQSKAQVERTQMFFELIDERFPNVDPDVRRRAAAVTRHLNGSRTWFEFRESFGFTGGEAGETSSWAINLVLDHLEMLEQEGRRSGNRAGTRNNTEE